jgi:galactose oxidase
MTVLTCRRLASVIRLAVVLLVQAIPAIAPSSALAQPAVKGQWSPKFDTRNVMIHASLLPNGKVLFWGRREVGEGLDPHNSTPRIWDPKTGIITETPKPGFNLFCGGHTFLSDGRLFVVGGHLSDSHGAPQAAIYDANVNTWSRIDDTIGGRWYPTAVTLPDGGVLVSFGSDKDGNLNNTQQVWKDNHWRTIVDFKVPPLYPRMHVVPDGRVFMSGPNQLTQFLDTSGGGSWMPLSERVSHVLQDYAPSVLYADGKTLYIGGGNAPLKDAEILDLSETPPRWKKTDDMHFARRQHNATLLPDGTVLVMGGTQGKGGESGGFNDLTPGQPIRSAELWDPKTGHWTLLAKASVDRAYHSTAVLLPDATVLSAGGGEYRPNNAIDRPNDPKDSHKDAQIFSPPYLFRGSGARPDISSAPDEVTYGETFKVTTSHPDQIGQVNWLRLSSVTHSFNSNQRINFLKFTADASSLSVTAPANAALCPPGHYMLFVLNKDNVPSVAKIIRIH